MSWDTKQDCIDDIVSQYNQAAYRFALADTDYDNAMTYWGQGNDTMAIMSIIMGWSDIYSGLNWLMVIDNLYTPKYGVAYCLQDYTGGDVTWQAICEAWAKDDFAGRAMTIGFIDRMRQILWNEPYKIAWAARPEQQD